MYLHFPIDAPPDPADAEALLKRIVEILERHATSPEARFDLQVDVSTSPPDHGMWSASAKSVKWLWRSRAEGRLEVWFTIASGQIDLLIDGGEPEEIVALHRDLAVDLGEAADLPNLLYQAELSTQEAYRADPACDALLDHLNAAGVELRPLDGAKLLFAAARRGRFERVEELLDRGVDPDASAERYGDTPLTVACSSMNRPLVELLLRRGADPNQQDALGRGPLVFVIPSGSCQDLSERAALMEVLCDAGADPNARTEEGRTVLHHLAYGFDPHVARALMAPLLAAGLDPSLRDLEGKTAADLAREWGRPEELAIALEHR